MEWHFDENAHVGSLAYHEGRDRAPHWEQEGHHGRMAKALEFIRLTGQGQIVDLGCGDGGLLAQLGDLDAWGYDFTPANIAGCLERGVRAWNLDVFANLDKVRWAPVVVLTEVLEHVDSPRTVLRKAAKHSRFIVASSPNGETKGNHLDCHQWGWDMPGYADMFEQCGWRVLRHETSDWSQVLLAEVI